MIWDERTTVVAVMLGGITVIGFIAMQLAYVLEKREQRKQNGDVAE